MSKETREKNRSLLVYIRKGLDIQEDFIFAAEGYKNLLDKTNNILKMNTFSQISEENLKHILKDATRINSKIVNWQEKINNKIPDNPEKYIPIYFFKWLGIDYIYSLHNLHHKSFYYLEQTCNGMDISHAIYSYIKKVKQVTKATNKAREILVNDNMALVHQQAHKVAGDRKDILDDLVSVAYYQFVQCMDKTFDMNKGTEFSTYVSNCIFHKCREAKIKYDEIIRIPNARMKDKTMAAKGELDLDAQDFKNDAKRSRESLIRNTISNSNMYWSLDKDSGDSEDSNGINENLVSDENQMKETTDSIMMDDVIQRIINKILSHNRTKKEAKIKALEYSGALDFNNNIGEQTLKTVAELLYQNGYTDTHVTPERARQLILAGKKLIKEQIVLEPEFMETLGLVKEA